MRTHQIAKKLNMEIRSVRYRLKYNGIFAKNKDYSEEEFNLISYERYSRVKKEKIIKHKKIAIDVVDYYLREKDNRAIIIAEKLNINTQTVHYILNYYLEHKCIIVESKLNEL